METKPQAFSTLARWAAEPVLADLQARRQIAANSPASEQTTSVLPDRWQRNQFLLSDAHWHAKETEVRAGAARLTPLQAAHAIWDHTARQCDVRGPLVRKLNPAPLQPLPVHMVPMLTLPSGPAVEFPHWRDWWVPLNVASPPGVDLLDAMLIRPPTLPANAPLLLVANGSGGIYERSLDISHALAVAHNMQVLVYNPRGVGNSLGRICSPQDLVSDFRCMLQEALRRAPQVAVLARSMGGGTASEGLAQLQAAAPQQAARVGLLLLENTFSRFSAAAAHQVRVSPELMGVIYGALGFQDLSPARALPHCAKSMRVVVSYIDNDAVIGEAAGLHQEVRQSRRLTLAHNLPRAGTLLHHSSYLHAAESVQALRQWRLGATPAGSS